MSDSKSKAKAEVLEEAAVSIFDEPGVRRVDITDSTTGEKAYYLEPSPKNRIPIYIPMLAEEGEGQVDQTVPVIVNGVTTIIKRGETVYVPFSVYEALVNTGKYPRL